MDLSSSKIFDQIKAGDRAAFKSVFDDYYQSLCRFVFTYLKDSDSAEEVVQNTFVKLWHRRSEIEITGSIKSYLFQSVKNSALNQLKHEKVVRGHEAHQMTFADTVQKAGTDLEAIELEEQIEISLDRLPKERKKIFLMSRSEGLKYKEIAEKLNISVKTVENQMGKALKYMREQLSEYLVLAGIVIWELLKSG